MEILLSCVQYFVDLGAAVMLPIVVFLVALGLGTPFGKAVKSGISIGIGFIGIGLVIGLMLNNLAPAAKAMSANFGINMSLIDVGWPGMSPITWASEIALVAIPISIAVNIFMLVLKLTRVVNIDIWNIWHFTFTGAMVHVATGSYVMGIAGVAIHAAFAYKLGDWFAPTTEKYFGLSGIAMPHGTTGTYAPIAVPIDYIIDRIPVIRDIDFNPAYIEKKFGMIGDPAIMGAIMGVGIGVLAGYDAKECLMLGIQMAAVIILMPQVVKHIMTGLLPVSETAKEMMQRRFKNSKFFIGLDCALLLGDSAVVTASLLFIPITIMIAALMPGNQVLPFGDLPTIGFFFAMAVGVHNGNLFRSIISGSVIMAMNIWIVNQTIGLTTLMAKNAGHVDAGAQVAALDQGGNAVTYIITEAFRVTDVVGLVSIGVIYIGCVIFTYFWSKKQYKEWEEQV